MSHGGGEADLYRRNRTFYDSLWRRVVVRRPEWFPTWRDVADIVLGRERILEIGPGARPRMPLDRTHFADLSSVALRKLKAKGARAVLANLVSLPYADGTFDLVCALDVMEHAPDQSRAFGEIARTLRPGGILLLAVPLRPELWTAFDEAVGHHLRYEREALAGLLAASGFTVLKCARFGLLPRSRVLARIGSWFLSRLGGPAAWFEDRLVLPLSRLFARPLRWSPGFALEPGAGGAILVLRRECPRTGPGN